MINKTTSTYLASVKLIISTALTSYNLLRGFCYKSSTLASNTAHAVPGLVCYFARDISPWDQA